MCLLYVNVNVCTVFERFVCCFGKVALAVLAKGEHHSNVCCINECYGGVNVRGVLLSTFLFQFLALPQRVLTYLTGYVRNL